MEFITFSEWLKLKADGNGKPRGPRGMNKIPHDNHKPTGVRTLEDDLSSDFEGHIAHNGEVAPYKVMKKKSC